MRQWVFRWRGYVLIPTAILIVVLCQPTMRSFLGGMIIACLGEALRIWGVGYSGLTTRSSKVTAPELVTAGPYAYVRNPLYLGNFITALGFYVIAAGGIGWSMRLLLLAILVTTYVAVYGLIIPLEEEYLEKTFGEPYVEYLRHVPRIVPQATPFRNAQGRFRWQAIQRGEIHTLLLFTAITVYMASRLAAEIRIWEVLTRG